MALQQKPNHELKAVGLAMSSFGGWIGALFGCNLLSVIRRRLGAGEGLRLFLQPMPRGPSVKQ